MSIALDEFSRNLGHFRPSIWGDLFISFSMDKEVLENYSKEVATLQEQVNDMLISDKGEMEKLTLINTLERLGISYLFGKEIEVQLEKLFNTYEDKNYDLFNTALHFRVFRQHGYKLSCNVFNKFKNGSNEFKKELVLDVDGLLSLYEATFLRVKGEDMLVQALEFTQYHLKSIAPSLDSVLAQQVCHALNKPLHRTSPRIEARRYITYYENIVTRNETLLRLAKVDFNRVQLIHRKEMAQVSRWYKDLITKAPYGRDRMVESFLWSTGGHFEPDDSFTRVLLAKAVAWMTLVDDAYDAYGTFEECKVITEVIKSWDLSKSNQLPNYMRETFRAILRLCDEVHQELQKTETTHALEYFIDMFQDMVRRYDQESEWINVGYIPTVEEYLNNNVRISTGFFLNHSLVGMGKIATIELFEWIRSEDSMVMASNTIGRLTNDITGRKKEQERKHVPSIVECHMNQYNVSVEETLEVLNKMIDDAWIHINERMLQLDSTIPKPVIQTLVNLTRIYNEMYTERGDNFTDGAGLKDQVLSLFVNPIPLK